jgi:putative nucleotide binding protein
MEDYAYILDYLAQGRLGKDGKRYTRESIALAIGDNQFKLFELIPKPDAGLQIGTRVYIGKDMELREHVAHVKCRIGFEELTATAQSEIPYILLEIVKSNEDRFTEFYNTAHPITTHYHMLELLPGLGKKTMWSIIAERKKGEFNNFEDIAKRVHGFYHPEKHISKRIELELKDRKQKYHLFTTR